MGRCHGLMLCTRCCATAALGCDSASPQLADGGSLDLNGVPLKDDGPDAAVDAQGDGGGVVGDRTFGQQRSGL